MIRFAHKMPSIVPMSFGDIDRLRSRRGPVPSATLATGGLAPHRDHESISATMSKRSRDVDQSCLLYRLAGYSITANHRPYRCNAIRSVLAFQHRAKTRDEGHQNLTEVWTYASHNFSLYRRREKVIAEPRA